MERVALRLRRKRRALDIGARVGYWSFWLAGQFSRVEAFEPLPVLQQCFRMNVTASNVRLHPCALGEQEPGADRLWAPLGSGTSSTLGGRTGAMPMRALDGFEFDEVDFIKLDAGSFEYFILRGGERTLLRDRPLILVRAGAFGGARGDKWGAAARYLQSLGARLLETLHGENYLFAWPGD